MILNKPTTNPIRAKMAIAKAVSLYKAVSYLIIENLHTVKPIEFYNRLIL